MKTTKRGRKPDQKQDKQLLTLLSKGLTYTAIGKIMGKERSTVKRRHERILRNRATDKRVESYPHIPS